MTQGAFILESPAAVAPQWREVDKGNAHLVGLADRHYTRQTPGSNQCCRPGKNLTLLLDDGSAGWVVWRPLPEVGRMDNLECWENTLFRNEGKSLSSDLIREATAWTFRSWGWPPRDGLLSAIGIEQTSKRRSRNAPPGACFAHAGWTRLDDRGGKAWWLAPHPQRTARP